LPAAEAAGKIGLAPLAPQLRELLADPEWWVRFRSGEALTRMGAEGARMLREAAEHAPEPGRTAAALTMAERGIA
jgi:HEAT repeat protein